MVLELVVVHVNEKEMENSTLSVDEMMDSITTQIDTLDPRRRYMFIEWLCAHSTRVKCAVDIQAGLNAWLNAMPAESTAWEFRTITNEIHWWRDQSERNVDRLMLEHLRSCS